MNMNNINLIGNITKELQVRGTEGKEYAYITLAVKRKRGEGSDFIDCVAFGKTAINIAKFCGKGHSLGITGRLQVDTKKNDNKWETKTQVIIEDITFIQPKNDGGKKETTLKEFFNNESEEINTDIELDTNLDELNLDGEVELNLNVDLDEPVKEKTEEPSEEKKSNVLSFEIPKEVIKEKEEKSQKEKQEDIDHLNEFDPFKLFEQEELDDEVERITEGL